MQKKTLFFIFFAFAGAVFTVSYCRFFEKRRTPAAVPRTRGKFLRALSDGRSAGEPDVLAEYFADMRFHRAIQENLKERIPVGRCIAPGASGMGWLRIVSEPQWAELELSKRA